jgi:hypothetical protein
VRRERFGAAGAEKRRRRPSGVVVRPLNFTVMRHSAVALILALAAGVGHGQGTAAEITKAEATRIALTAAGCKKAEDCIASGRLDHDKWVFVIVFIEGRDAAGDFLMKPNGWTEVAVDSQGHVIGKMPGK